MLEIGYLFSLYAQCRLLIVAFKKEALMSWFFVDFRSGVLFFMVILVIFKCKNW